MNKRLRKKKRVGEFVEYGFNVNFAMNFDYDSGTDGKSYALFHQLETKFPHLGFGGGWGGSDLPFTRYNFFVTAIKKNSSVTEEDRLGVMNWIDSLPNLIANSLVVGELEDVNS